MNTIFPLNELYSFNNTINIFNYQQKENEKKNLQKFLEEDENEIKKENKERKRIKYTIYREKEILNIIKQSYIQDRKKLLLKLPIDNYRELLKNNLHEFSQLIKSEKLKIHFDNKNCDWNYLSLNLIQKNNLMIFCYINEEYCFGYFIKNKNYFDLNSDFIFIIQNKQICILKSSFNFNIIYHFNYIELIGFKFDFKNKLIYFNDDIFKYLNDKKFILNSNTYFISNLIIGEWY